MSLKEKFNVTHHFPRNKRHSMPRRATGESTSVGQESERSKRKPRPQLLLGFLIERQVKHDKQLRMGYFQSFQWALGFRGCPWLFNTWLQVDLWQWKYWPGVLELDKEGVGGMDSRLVGLYMKSRLTDKLFSVSRNQLTLGGQSFPSHKASPKML